MNKCLIRLEQGGMQFHIEAESEEDAIEKAKHLAFEIVGTDFKTAIISMTWEEV